jgi:hypothetical protein
MKEISMKIRFSFFIFLIVLLLSILPNSQTQAAAINAASCSQSAVQIAINSAVTGDTVVVPAGNCTWAASVDIPNGKNITVQGAGIGNTTISRNGDIAFHLNDTSSRITGFTLNNAMVFTGEGEVGNTINNDWRIDHNRFVGTGGFDSLVVIYCSLNDATNGQHCRGLIDNNQFDNGAFAAPYGFKATVDLHRTWAQPTALGSANMVFIEDNVFTCAGCNLPHYTDTNYGGRFVFRFNTITNEAAEVHSLQQWRASRAWEIYKNTTTNTIGWTAGLIRGGTGVAWGNTMSSGLGPWVLDNVRSFNTGYDYGNCDGASTADGNTPGQEGWPCRDQIGRGQDAGLSNPSSLTSTASGWYPQASEPAYFFLNRTGSSITAIDTSGRGRSSTLHVLPNRDFYNEVSFFNGTSGIGSGTLSQRPATCTTGVGYWATDQGEWNSRQAGSDGQLYKCTSTNTWTLYYTPYTYPHPLQGGTSPPPDTTPPSAPAGLTVQ